MAARCGPMNRTYFLIAWACMIAGIVFVFSASYPDAGRPDDAGLAGNPYKYLLLHSKHVAVGLVLLLAMSRVSPAKIRLCSTAAFAITLGLVGMTLCTPFGDDCGTGAYRWLQFPGLPRFQPSELLKVAFIPFIAGLLARKDERSEHDGRAYWQVLAATGVVGLVLLMQPNQGMATIFVLVTLTMLFLAGASLTWLAPLSAALGAAGLLVAHMAPYRWERVIAFLDPEKYLDGVGYHNMNMLISLARGGFCGLGLGMSPDKWRWLPTPHTDSIFCVIGGELGFIGGVAVLIAFAFLTYQGARIAMASRNAFAWYLTLGVAVTIGLQGLIHVAVATSCVPCTGLTLPFISAGGTSMVAVCMAAGMVLSVSRYPSNGSVA